MPTPLDEYRARAQRWHTQHTKSEQRSRQLGNARLITGLAAVAIAALAIGAGVLSPWWLLLPLIVFVVLAILHDRADKQRDAALRGTAYYDRALARIENRWIGKGHQGEAFRDPKHLYADDLDLLGPGSAFELLSTSAHSHRRSHASRVAARVRDARNRERAPDSRHRTPPNASISVKTSRSWAKTSAPPSTIKP